ncbi:MULTISPECIES: type I secretion system protein LssZ [unclassified Legionella]|uniref:type I secretion system protein LssZ n=1 Tax=Legionella sp. PC997 TaxID=2755562 RepID=UPI0015FE0298|nr:type I secretion system protein LssZ [Legionella sp. PC997]QMT60417.1 type I secretion system protein LssZ [Legionella sp. PC997]
MYTLGKLIQSLFPLIALVLFIIGIKRHAIYYIISSLWLSLIALLIHFQFSGNEIFGTYFNYLNAGIYSFNLLILLLALIQVISHLSINAPAFKYAYTFVNALLVVGAFILISNLWINAFFIENKMEGTPVMQVALFDKPGYCDSKYVFYKIDRDSSVAYLCPNYYGLLPSVGHLATSPDFITTQMSLPIKKQMLLKQKNKS